MSTLKNYASEAFEVILYEKVNPSHLFSKILYLCCGLGGETGELQEKVKKIVRDKNSQYSKEDKDLIIKELGDIHWYWSAICKELEIDPDEVLQVNLQKLQDRIQRDKLSGSGDER